MNFSEIIKKSVLQVINAIRFTEICIGDVIEEDPLKIKIEEKLFLSDNEIIKTSSFSGLIKKGTRLLFIREGGGQRYFLIDTILVSDEEK